MPNLSQITDGLIGSIIYTEVDEDSLDNFRGLTAETDKRIRSIIETFYRENEKDLLQLQKDENIDMYKIGQCVWYAWQGFGVAGFCDMPETPLNERLYRECEKLPKLTFRLVGTVLQALCHNPNIQNKA